MCGQQKPTIDFYMCPLSKSPHLGKRPKQPCKDCTKERDKSGHRRESLRKNARKRYWRNPERARQMSALWLRRQGVPTWDEYNAKRCAVVNLPCEDCGKNPRKPRRTKCGRCDWRSESRESRKARRKRYIQKLRFIGRFRANRAIYRLARERGYDFREFLNRLTPHLKRALYKAVRPVVGGFDERTKLRIKKLELFPGPSGPDGGRR
jgi:hypothetical protein